MPEILNHTQLKLFSGIRKPENDDTPLGMLLSNVFKYLSW
jgi:hypothetical protein